VAEDPAVRAVGAASIGSSGGFAGNRMKNLKFIHHGSVRVPWLKNLKLHPINIFTGVLELV
jgi:hypothetical protein